MIEVAIFCLVILANAGILALLVKVTDCQSMYEAIKQHIEAIDAELALYAKVIGETMQKREEQEESSEKQRIVNGGVEPWQFMQSKNSEGI